MTRRPSGWRWAPGGVARNSLLNVAGSVVGVAVAVVTVPLYLRVFGEVRYGVWVVVWFVFTYFGLFDLGLGRATVNQIARARAGADGGAGAIVWTACALSVCVGLVGGLVLYVAGSIVPGGTVGIPDELVPEVERALPWLAAAVPAMTVSIVLVGALEGTERFLLVNVLGTVGALLFQVGPLVAGVLVGATLDVLLAAAVVAVFLNAALTLAACRRSLGIAGRPRAERARVTALFRYGGWITISSVAAPLFAGLDRVVIGSMLGPRAVTHYAIPFNAVTRLWLIPGSLSRALIPRFSAGGTGADALRERSVAALAVVLTPLVTVGIVAAEPLLALWVGPGVAEPAAPVATVLLAGIWINSLAFVPYAQLLGRRRPDLPAKFHLLELGPFVALLAVAVREAGIVGAALVWTARVLVDAILLFAAVGVSAREVRFILVAAAIVALAAGHTALFDDHGWRAGVGALLVGAACAWALRSAASTGLLRVEAAAREAA